MLKALVQEHIDEFEDALDKRLSAKGSGSAARGYFHLMMEHIEKANPAPSGLLAALSEDPELLAPVRQTNRKLLDRLKRDAGDESMVLLLFLALEGMRAQKLFGTEVLTAEETTAVLNRLNSILEPN